VSEENYGWLFIDVIPLLCDKKRVARQMKIETWLDLYQLTADLGLQKPKNHVANADLDYIV
jgi:hypothetical protein